MTEPQEPGHQYDKVLRPLYIMLALVGLLVVGGGVYGFVTTASLRSNDRAIVDQRTTARVRECVRDNEQLERARKRERESWLNYIKHITGGRPLPPSEQAKVEPFLADQDKLVLDEFAPRAPRGCDKGSIDAYYQAQTGQ